MPVPFDRYGDKIYANQNEGLVADYTYRPDESLFPAYFREGLVVELSAKIASLAPGRLSKIVYVSGGSEAVETAIKLAKQYHIAVGKKPRAHKIISRWNAYHGATMGALAATDWLGTRHISEPGVPGCMLSGRSSFGWRPM